MNSTLTLPKKDLNSPDVTTLKCARQIIKTAFSRIALNLNLIDFIALKKIIAAYKSDKQKIWSKTIHSKNNILAGVLEKKYFKNC